MINQFHQKPQAWDKPLDSVKSAGMDLSSKDKITYNINVAAGASRETAYQAARAAVKELERRNPSIIYDEQGNSIGMRGTNGPVGCVGRIGIEGEKGPDGEPGVDYKDKPSLKPQYARIIPGEDRNKDGVHRAVGTKVMIGDQELYGVTRVTMTAEVGTDLWKAEIECFVQMPKEIKAEANIKSRPEYSLGYAIGGYFGGGDPSIGAYVGAVQGETTSPTIRARFE